MSNTFFQRIAFSIIILTLAGCSGKAADHLATPTSTIVPAAENTPSPIPSPTSTPLPDTLLKIGVEGDTLQPGVIAYLFSIHPNFTDSIFHALVHPGLYKLDPRSGDLQPVLAAASAVNWEGQNGVWTLPVQLKPGASWSDGSPITTSDILFSFELLQELAKLHIIDGEDLLSASISESAPGTLQFTMRSEYTPATAATALLTFPVIQKGFWQDKANLLLNGDTAELIRTTAGEIDLVLDERGKLELEADLLYHEITDDRIQLSIKQSLLGEYVNFINDKKTPANLNGVKDGETVVTALRAIPTLHSEIALLQENLSASSSRQEEIRTRLVELVNRHEDLLEQAAILAEKLKLSILDMELGSEPLAIPYHIRIIAPDRVDLVAIAHQESRPNYISFQSLPATDLLKAFNDGSLDAIFPLENHQDVAGIQFMVTSKISSFIINPLSEKMADPSVSQAVACIFSSPDLWQDAGQASPLLLQSYYAPAESQKKQPGCSGTLRNRQLNMRTVLSQRYFTWKFLKDGTIIPGSMIDPAGQSISPLTLVVDPDTNLPPGVPDKLASALKPLGIDLVISQSTSILDAENGSADIIITSWKTTLPLDGQICTISGVPGFFRFPVQMQTSLSQDCRSSLSVGSNSLYREYSWLILINNYELVSYWNPAILDAYDLEWIRDLSPSWNTVW